MVNAPLAIRDKYWGHFLGLHFFAACSRQFCFELRLTPIVTSNWRCQSTENFLKRESGGIHRLQFSGHLFPHRRLIEPKSICFFAHREPVRTLFFSKIRLYYYAGSTVAQPKMQLLSKGTSAGYRVIFLVDCGSCEYCTSYVDATLTVLDPNGKGDKNVEKKLSHNFPLTFLLNLFSNGASLRPESWSKIKSWIKIHKVFGAYVPVENGWFSIQIAVRHSVHIFEAT